MTPNTWPARLGIGLVGILAGRLLYLALSYFVGVQDIFRYQIESACLIWVAAGLALRVARHVEKQATLDVSPRDLPLWTAAFWIAASLVLYWPALSIGFLSDDYGLVERAASFDFTAFNSEAFRPVPLALWAGVLTAGGGARTLHLLNIAGHGLNAFLAARVAKPFVSRPWTVFAGLLMLTLPIAPEAVVWCAGIFDVLATLFMLAVLLIARAYDDKASPARRLWLFVAAFAALLSKETALMLPLLLLADAFGRRRMPRRLVVDLGMLTTLWVGYGAVRFFMASAGVRRDVTRYILQRALFGTFAGLGAPWHITVMTEHRALPITTTVAILAIGIIFFIRTNPTARRTRIAIMSAAWVIIPILPALTFVTVAPNLEGSRLLYASGIGWAILLAIAAAPERDKSAQSNYLALGLLVVIASVSAFGVRLHLRPWEDAGRLRDRIETAVTSDSRFHACQDVMLRDLPDNVAGAYVFRNGVTEAFARDLGRRATPGSDSGPCSFRWTGSGFEN